MCLKLRTSFSLFSKPYDIKALYSKTLNLRYTASSECPVKADVDVGASKINMTLLWFYLLVFPSPGQIRIINTPAYINSTIPCMIYDSSQNSTCIGDSTLFMKHKMSYL